MAVLSTAAKAKAGTKAAKTAVKNPVIIKGSAKASKLGAKAAKPIVKRRAKNRAQTIGGGLMTVGEALRSAADELVTYGPSAAQELGLVEAPKPRRTAPRVLVGVVIGAGAMYFLDPEHGKEHRDQVAGMVS